MTTEKPYLPWRQAHAEIRDRGLTVTEESFRGLIDAKILPSVRIGRRVFIARAELDTFAPIPSTK